MRWMRGQISSEYVVGLLSKEFCLDREDTWRNFVNECETMCVSVATLQMVQLLRQTHYVLLVTGNADCFSRFTAPALNLDWYFDGVINSADCKLMKDDDDGALFRRLSAKYGVPLSRCSLIDDSLSITRLFGRLGGRPFLVQGCHETDQALTELIGARRRIPQPSWDDSEQSLLAA